MKKSKVTAEKETVATADVTPEMKAAEKFYTEVLLKEFKGARKSVVIKSFLAGVTFAKNGN